MRVVVLILILFANIRVTRGEKVSPLASELRPHLGTRRKAKSCVECQVYIDLRELQQDSDQSMRDRLRQAVDEGRRQQIKREMNKRKRSEGAEQSGYPFYQQLDQDDPKELAKDQQVNECLKLPVNEQKVASSLFREKKR